MEHSTDYLSENHWVMWSVSRMDSQTVRAIEQLGSQTALQLIPLKGEKLGKRLDNHWAH